MTLPTNTLQTVQTFNEVNLAYLQNLSPFLSTSNKKFKDFQTANPSNLGATIGFDKPPRFRAGNSLVVNFQGVEQRVQTLTVDKPFSIGMNVSAEELIFNIDPMNYMDRFGRAAVQELGAVVESDIASLCVSAPYRFYGNGITPINSSEQLASALALFRNYGAAPTETKGYLSDIAIPSIVGSNLNQFAMNRNNEEANSWELGDFSNCSWYSSNLLPVHTAGTEGVQQATLTVVSTTTDADGAVTAITFSGCTSASDADSIKENDKGQFQDGVSGQADLRYLTWTGHKVSANPVQFRVTADAASTGASQVTVTVDPPLQANADKNQNINRAIVAGQQVKFLPSHRAGMIQSGNQFYVAMPKLPSTAPYTSSTVMDKDTGASMRMYTGAGFGNNEYGSVIDCILGYTQVSDNAMSVIFPL